MIEMVAPAALGPEAGRSLLEWIDDRQQAHGREARTPPRAKPPVAAARGGVDHGVFWTAACLHWGRIEDGRIEASCRTVRPRGHGDGEATARTRC